MKYGFRDVIPKTRTNTIGRTETFKLSDDINKQSLDDIHQMMRQIAVDETTRQAQLNNNFERVIIDNRNNGNIEYAQKSIEVLFGTALPAKAMLVVEEALFTAIRQSTKPNTGKLAANDYWQWIYVQQGNEIILQRPKDLTTFRRGDVLILKPKLPYATLVNNVVAGTGSVSYRARKRNNAMGFLGFAAQKAKRNPAFRSLTIYAARDPAYSLQGELSNQGTGFIVIKPSRARRYRRL